MKHETPHELIEAVRPVLSNTEREELFAAIMKRVEIPVTPRVVVSPYTTFIQRIFSHPLAYVATLLMVVLGGGGTVAAANAAKPGDFLFPLDLATERVQLALASPEHKAMLEAEFIDERIAEVSVIVDEETLVPGATTTVPITITRKGEDRIARALAVLASQLDSAHDQVSHEQAVRELLSHIDRIHVEHMDDKESGHKESQLQREENTLELRTDPIRERTEQQDGTTTSRGNQRDGDDGTHDEYEQPRSVVLPESRQRENESSEESHSSRQSATSSIKHNIVDQVGTTTTLQPDSEEVHREVKTTSVRTSGRDDDHTVDLGHARGLESSISGSGSGSNAGGGSTGSSGSNGSSGSSSDSSSGRSGGHSGDDD